MYYKEQLESMRKSLCDLLSDLSFELGDLPEGCLYAYEKGGKFYYCRRFPKGGNRKKEHREAITKDSTMVLALVRKRYVEAAIENLKSDIAEIDRTISNYRPVGEQSVMREFVSKYPALIEGLNYGRRDPKKWARQYSPSEGFYEENLKSVSAQGEKMRSGGEMYIAARLDHYGIPYRYEDSSGLHPDLRYVPDFKILRPRDRKIFFWEHFGKVNDYEYVRNNIVKVSDYIEYGIRPWDNLIMTFNNEKGGYNGKIIDAMIECWLL